jgi:hypothetical protein
MSLPSPKKKQHPSTKHNDIREEIMSRSEEVTMLKDESNTKTTSIVYKRKSKQRSSGNKSDCRGE